uniref:Uncharacterized protein n=1 Tax=Parascaris univalens TaxID=6257 RepID=A0A915C317_PARUN
MNDSVELIHVCVDIWMKSSAAVGTALCFSLMICMNEETSVSLYPINAERNSSSRVLYMNSAIKSRFSLQNLISYNSTNYIIHSKIICSQ